MTETRPFDPIATAGMMIRRPVHDVFEAFVDPAVTTRFWFTESTGRLEAGKAVTWTWGMYNVSDEIQVKALEMDRRIEFTWSGPDAPTTVIWTFTSLDDQRTFVDIVNSGFSGTTEEKATAAIDSTGGFSWVLAGAKALLEHSIELNLVGDRFPPEMGEH